MARGKKKAKKSEIAMLLLINKDGKHLPIKELSGVAKLVEVDVKKEFIHFDRMPDGDWRLTYTKGIIS